MSKQKNKSNVIVENIAPEEFDHAIQVFKALKVVTKDILSTTQLYTDEIYEFILKRITAALNTTTSVPSNNLFGITKEEFDFATRNIQFNPRLTTILSLSYSTRQPFDYSQLAYSIPLSITTLSLLYLLTPK